MDNGFEVQLAGGRASVIEEDGQVCHVAVSAGCCLCALDYADDCAESHDSENYRAFRTYVFVCTDQV